MLQLTPQHRLLLAVEPVDFRKGICGLKGLCLNHLDLNPFSGTVFAFTNRARTSVKLLVYDASGFWLCQKRFSEGKLAWWPKSNDKTESIRASELMILLAQGNPEKAAIPDDWKPVNQAAINSEKVTW
tara:strand:- start:304 stop:687 length:384 start_codon:yes stop_codon:yes gene_type:complete